MMGKTMGARSALIILALLLVLGTGTATAAPGTGVLTWGGNEAGQLGVTQSGDQWTPVEVIAPGAGLDAGAIRMVAAGLRHSLALTNDGTVWAWGDNRFGQLGDNLVSVGGPAGISRGPGGPHPRQEVTPVATPVKVAGPGGAGFLTGVAEIAAGGNHSLARGWDGTVWAWGNNQFGQLGDNTTTDRHVPVQVLGPDGRQPLKNATAIAAGYQHSLAIRLDVGSTLWAWGENGRGQLGDNSTRDRHLPVQVATGRSATTDVYLEIAAGGGHSLARRSDGTLWAWGANGDGQLGDGTRDDRHAPVQVQGLPPGRDAIRQIAAGHSHSLAIVASGVDAPGLLLSWGHNGAGQLGDGTTTDRTSPVHVVGAGGVGNLTGVVAVRGGWMHTLAARGDTTVWAWGDGGAGRLGNGTDTDSPTPVQARGGATGEPFLKGVHSILSAGFAHNLAVPGHVP